MTHKINKTCRRHLDLRSFKSNKIKLILEFKLFILKLNKLRSTFLRIHKFVKETVDSFSG